MAKNKNGSISSVGVMLLAVFHKDQFLAPIFIIYISTIFHQSYSELIFVDDTKI